MADLVSHGLMVFGAGLLLAAALHDAAARTIPNWTPACLAVTGLILRLQDGKIIAGLGIATLLLLILGALWLRGFIGGGDVKLIPAAALLLPPSSVPALVLSIAIAGGALALLYLCLPYLVRRPRPGPRHGLLARALKAEAWRVHRRGPLPYAVAIAGGAFPIIVKTLSG
jgi:prepilin peptidase CpaA